MTGTLLNATTVIVGGSVGALVGGRLPERYRQTAMQAIGLMTLLIGIQMALGMRSAIIVLGSLVLGAITGETLRIEDGLTALGNWVERRVRTGANRAPVGSEVAESGSLISKGFVTASLIFCVGPMTILGSFQDGLTGVYSTLAVKSLLDGFAALALASSLGWGVILSSVTILLYQGALTLGAAWAKPFLTDPIIAEMTATGGLLIVGIGLTILDIKRVRVASMLPALVFAPVLTGIFG